MNSRATRDKVLVLASRRSFESFVGPVPRRLESIFRFLKPSQAARIAALLPECRLVVSKSYLPARINRWIFAARRMGIPTWLLIDGPLEWSNLYRSPSLLRQMGSRQSGLFEPIIQDGVVGIGEAQIRWVAHKNAGRGVELMSYANRRIRTAGRDDSGPDRGSDAHDLDFLVTTARTPYFDETEKRDLVRILVDLCRALTAGGYRHALRIFDETLLHDLREEIPSVPVDSSGSFSDALARTRCVISGPSSVLLEAMEHGKPTGTLMFRDGPLFYQTGWLLGCASDWEASLRSMLDADPKRMDFQRQVLQENLSDQDFFEHCERFLAREEPDTTRPLDGADLEFENRTLHRLLGWRARLFAPLLRRFHPKND